MSSPVKEGYLQRYKDGFLVLNKWRSIFVVLYSDSTLVFFNNTVNKLVTTITDTHMWMC